MNNKKTNKRWELLKAKSRVPGVHMVERDLSELYTYLELFGRTYTVCAPEVMALMQTVKDIYILQTGISDEEAVFRALRNPRNAGRKKKVTEGDSAKIKQLSGEGMTVRAIAEELHIPKSTVQRMLHPGLSWN